MCDYYDIILVLVGGAIGLFSSLTIEYFRNRTVNRNSYEAIKGEIESNIESAELAVLSEHLWSNIIYKANLNKLHNFDNKIKDVVKFYYKIENYKYRYNLYLEIQSKLIDKPEDLTLKQNSADESNVLLSLASEISKLGNEIINKKV